MLCMRLLQAILFVGILTVALAAPAALAAKAKPADKPADKAQAEQPKKKRPKADADDGKADPKADAKRKKPAADDDADDSAGNKKKTKPDGAAVAARLREEWDIGTTRMFRLAVDDSTFTPELKKTLGDASDKFADEQEALLSDAEKDPCIDARALRHGAEAQEESTKAVNTAYKEHAVQKERNRRRKAMEKEIEQVAVGADALLASLDD